jgi:stage V sporulation protein D (sporulation-specific penicillin-binding protein)
MPARTSHRAVRALTALVAFAAAFLVLGVRLAWLQLDQGPALAAAARAEQDRELQIVPTRGEIVDRDGHVLAEDQMAESLYALPPEVTDPESEAATVARITGLPPAGILQALRSRAQWVWVAHRLPQDQYRALAAARLPGLYFQQEPQRVYPAGDLAASVLGFTGADGGGLDGVEYYFNKVLTGKPGQVEEGVDAYGNPLPAAPLRYTPPQNGLTVQLTLDTTLQYLAQTLLAQTVADTHAASGLALAMDVRTGAILAMANVPTFDPNHWQAVPPARWRNPAVESDVQPGSAFKPVVAAAAIDTGQAAPGTRYPDPSGHITITGATIYNWNFVGLGHPTLTEALEQSDNVVFSQVAMSLGVDRFYRYFDRFGFNRPTGVDLPGEASSVAPAPSAVRPLDLATMGFGQTLAVTPLQLLTAISAIANGGILMRPHIEQALLGPDGRPVATVAPHPEGRVIAPATAAAVTQMMVAVVEQGLGQPAQVPGYWVAGKTGTAQIPSPRGGYLPNSYLVSFVGFAPADRPALAVLVMVSQPHGQNAFGSTVAGPVFAQLIAQGMHDLGIPPERPLPVVTPSAGATAGR